MSGENKKDFSRFGASFQEELVFLILTDRPFAEQMEEVLDPKFFEFPYLRGYIRAIFDFRAKYTKHPTPDNMTAVLATLELDDLDKSLVQEFHQKIVDNNHDFNQQEFVKGLSLDFCRKMKLAEAISRSIDFLENKKFDSIKVEIEEALKLGADRDFGHDFKKDIEIRYQPQIRNPVTTGWDVIDRITKGGLGAGEFGLVIAPSGVGKSFMLVNVASAALKEGKTVVYYTLELADTSVAKRFDSNISKIPLDELELCKEQVEEAVINCPGTLIVKEWPTKSASIINIARHLESLQQLGVKVDLVVVDYIDLLKPVSNYEEKRFELESTYEGMRGLAKTLKIPIWSATQSNREGSRKDTIDNDSVAEAYNKIFVADLILTLSRSPQDVAAHTGRIFVSKNRNGVDKIKLPAHVNHGKCEIIIYESDAEVQQYQTRLANEHKKAAVDRLAIIKKGLAKKRSNSE